MVERGVSTTNSTRVFSPAWRGLPYTLQTTCCPSCSPEHPLPSSPPRFLEREWMQSRSQLRRRSPRTSTDMARPHRDPNSCNGLTGGSGPLELAFGGPSSHHPLVPCARPRTRPLPRPSDPSCVVCSDPRIVPCSAHAVHRSRVDLGGVVALGMWSGAEDTLGWWASVAGRNEVGIGGWS